MGRDPVKVCVRTRPTASFAQDVIVIDKEAQVRRTKSAALDRSKKICPRAQNDLWTLVKGM